MINCYRYNKIFIIYTQLAIKGLLSLYTWAVHSTRYIDINPVHITELRATTKLL